MVRLISIPAVLASYERGVRFRCGCGRYGLPDQITARIRSGEIKVTQLMVCSLHGEPMVETAARSESTNGDDRQR